MNKALAITGVLLLAAAASYWNATRDPFATATVGLIDSDPVQTDQVLAPFVFPNFNLITTNYLITPLAGYDIKARVLAKTRYFANDMAGDVVPYDFGLGWRSMSDLTIVAPYFTFAHEGMAGGTRLLRSDWKYGRSGRATLPPSSLGDIQVQYSNNHLIPANEDVFHKLGHIQTGDLVHLKGYLVRVERPDRPGWSMTSSTDRTDTTTHWGGNNNNCEIMFVTDATRITSTLPYTEQPIPDGWW